MTVSNGGVLEAFFETVNVGSTLLTLSQSSLTMNPGTFDIDLIDLASSSLTSSAGLVSLMVGSLLTIQPGEEIDNDVVFLSGSSVTAGETLVTVNGNSTLAVAGDLLGGSGFSSVTVTGGGLLEIVDSPGSLLDGEPGVDVSVALNFSGANNSVTSSNTLVTVENSSLTTGDALILLLSSFGSNSLTVDEGGLLAINNSTGDLANGLPGVGLADSVLSSDSPILNVTTRDTWVTVNNSTLRVSDALFDISFESDITALIVSQGGLLTVTNSLGNLSTGLPGVKLDSFLNLSKEDLSTNGEVVFSTRDTLVSVDASTIQVGELGGASGPAFTMTNIGFFDDGENFSLLGFEVTDGGVLTLSNGSSYGGTINVVDAELLAATQPLVKLLNSIMATGSGFVDVNTGSTFLANLPADALVSLAASSLTIRDGSLVNITGAGSVINVTGNLVSLTNGSTLNINNGFLVSVLDSGTFSLFGGLVNFGAGSGGGNTFNLTNPALCIGCTVNRDFVVPILLQPGATIANVTITGNTPFPGAFSNSNSLNLGNAAVIELGQGASINLQLPTVFID